MNTGLSQSAVRELQGRQYTGTVTCFFCYNGVGQIFMAKRSKQARDERGAWDVGGGGLEFGLEAESNVRKEVREEYGVGADKIDFLGYRDIIRDTRDGMSHWVALDFAVLVQSETPIINEPHKFDEAGWFDIGDLPQPLHSQVAKAFEKYQTTLQNLSGAV